jgi:hypothetical protein
MKERARNDLVNFAVEAHGGLKRWSRVTSVTAAASITGETWKLKGKPDYLKNVIFEVMGEVRRHPPRQVLISNPDSVPETVNTVRRRQP